VLSSRSGCPGTFNPDTLAATPLENGLVRHRRAWRLAVSNKKRVQAADGNNAITRRDFLNRRYSARAQRCGPRHSDASCCEYRSCRHHGPHLDPRGRSRRPAVAGPGDHARRQGVEVTDFLLLCWLGRFDLSYLSRIRDSGFQNKIPMRLRCGARLPCKRTVRGPPPDSRKIDEHRQTAVRARDPTPTP
jgi:hypothetical protein